MPKRKVKVVVKSDGGLYVVLADVVLEPEMKLEISEEMLK